MPQIFDSRLSFVIGDFTTTCTKIPELLRNRIDGKVLFIFDLDLFAPSYAAWKEISSHLRPGDLFYFDQAFDLEGERLIIEEYLMKEKVVEFVGRSVIGCGFEIT